ncbi:hypothetical protein CROQUDRAFT_89013 [Cronartium quercuum f. sp. fusiforme G11]|uniref:Uncharacterized protein n=1 Tax=Cronartium quercuum f. sp. fusiforme G11 TaxID=708437 RepID=A0A9P6TF85_9BASI|nr:hypothetical protein CROQUDRAFT_89013 [Cronartium quercuum f. sp. fusiforme G11]
MDMKAMDLEQAGFKWTKDSVLGMWYQLRLPVWEVEEAIQAESQEHGSMSTTTLANFNAIDLNATQAPITGNH